MSSSFDISSSSIKTVTKSHKSRIKTKKSKEFTSSAKSISENLLNEDQILTSLILNNDLTENYTNKYSSELFTSDSESTKTSSSEYTTSTFKAKNKRRNKRDSFETNTGTSSSFTRSTSTSSFTTDVSTKQNTSFSYKSKPNSSSKNKYTQDFESLTDESSLDTELEDYLNLSESEREVIKKNDHLKYLILKIKSDQKNSKIKEKIKQTPLKYFMTDKNQIDKLKTRVWNYSDKKVDPYRTTLTNNDVKIRSDLINKLDAVNMKMRIKRELAKKIDEFGKELDTGLSITETNKRNQAIYLKNKCNQITSKITNNHFDQHEIFYCDSIMMIGHLAETLPKLNDPQDDVWNKLLKPLEQLNEN